LLYLKSVKRTFSGCKKAFLEKKKKPNSLKIGAEKMLYLGVRKKVTMKTISLLKNLTQESPAVVGLDCSVVTILLVFS